MIYYDIRTHEWCKDLDTTYLPPETYFEIHCSDDDLFHHEFLSEKGYYYSFTTKDDKEFNEEYSRLDKEHHFLYRKSWSIPKEFYDQGLKYFNIDND